MHRIPRRRCARDRVRHAPVGVFRAIHQHQESQHVASSLLRLAAARHGIALEIAQPPFGQYFNATLDPASELLEAAPDLLILAPDARALGLPAFSDTPEDDVAAAVDRFAGVWDAVRRAAPDRFAWRDPPYEYEREKLPIDILAGTSTMREQLENGVPVERIVASWQPAVDAFLRLREKFLFYPD